MATDGALRSRIPGHNVIVALVADTAPSKFSIGSHFFWPLWVSGWSDRVQAPAVIPVEILNSVALGDRLSSQSFTHGSHFIEHVDELGVRQSGQPIQNSRSLLGIHNVFFIGA